VFELTPNSTRTEWTETVLYSFGSAKFHRCLGPRDPSVGLAIDASGNLYGVAGELFELIRHPADNTYSDRVFYAFSCPGAGFAPCPDGFNPGAGLVFDGRGDLYGTTVSGGAHGLFGEPTTGGKVFELKR
jgi:hypothetical protein